MKPGGVAPAAPGRSPNRPGRVETAKSLHGLAANGDCVRSAVLGNVGPLLCMALASSLGCF